MTHNPNKDACEESGVCSFVGKLGREISEKYEMYQQLAALRALLDHVRTYVRTYVGVLTYIRTYVHK